ncbi:hypothetical protein BaRGS_00023304, partial [Batillaria attramentaria]
MSNCGNNSDLSIVVPDDTRDTTIVCRGFSSNYSVVWTFVLTNSTRTDNHTIGSCGAYPTQCQSGSLQGYTVTRPSPSTSVLTINAVESSEWFQTGNVTCSSKTNGEEALNKTCSIIVTTVDECASDPCRHNGTCSDTRGSFSCTCAPTFRGKLCQSSIIDYCGSAPCMNGGTCTSLEAFHTCECPSKWNGHNCERENLCNGKSCLNGGTCFDRINYFKCECRPNYLGERGKASGRADKRDDQQQEKIKAKRTAEVAASEFEAFIELGKRCGLEGEKLLHGDGSSRSREKQRRHELELRTIELELQRERATEPNATNNNDQVARAPKLPAFNENSDKMDAYLERFERFAASNNWGQETWAIKLSALLTGKALDFYARLPRDEAEDHNKLKGELLKNYDFTEGYRRRGGSTSARTKDQTLKALTESAQRYLDVHNLKFGYSRSQRTSAPTGSNQDNQDTLRELFQRLTEANFTIRPSKCILGTDNVDFIGHRLSEGPKGLPQIQTNRFKFSFIPEA